METMNITISGMHCASCSRLITMDLEDIGVVVKINEQHNTGEIVFDPGKITREKIFDQIRKTGYEARELVS
ncbi:MAG TPA: heavy metal transporter [Candidatus Kerfeldbacteria bacterium]|nr:heavy metal transporter [Candidatus Kerfeldbacteria bacterium]HCM67923.1 heavy metal transporter [Candidatus Kerfeldbacteria bacterium]